MKEDNYHAESSNRFELVSIEQAKFIALLVSYHLPVLWWIQAHRKTNGTMSGTILPYLSRNTSNSVVVEHTHRSTYVGTRSVLAVSRSCLIRFILAF